MSKDKMKGYSSEKMSENDQIEALETKEPELVPDGETVVPKGDEAMPSSATDPKEARKALYDKARKNRETLISRDREGDADIELINQMNAEAAGGEKPESEIDTNRHGRNDSEDYDERVAAAKAMAEGQEKAREKKAEPEPEEENTKETSSSASDSLSAPDPDAKVSVVILGKEYAVPQQDIDDAGGIESYQKNRAATIKLQRAATLEKRAHQALQELEQRGSQQSEDPSTDGLDEADIEGLKDKLLDAVLNGTEEDVNEAIANVAKSRPEPTKPSSTEPAVRPEPSRDVHTETQEELQEQFEADMREANEMMRTEFKDIMNDPDALELARRNFNALIADPANEGRTQKEMSREAAMKVRQFWSKWGKEQPRNDIEAERQTRIERKRKLPKPSGADAPAPSTAKPEKHIPSRREHFMRLRRMQGHDT